MTLRAVAFDLGGVLELDVIELVDHGLDTRWEARLGWQAGELEHRMQAFWRAGSVGACTEEEVREAHAGAAGHESGTGRGVHA